MIGNTVAVSKNNRPMSLCRVWSGELIHYFLTERVAEHILTLRKIVLGTKFDLNLLLIVINV